VLEYRLQRGHQVPVGQLVVVQHVAVGDAEQLQRRRRGPPGAILAGRAMEERGPVCGIGDVAEERPVGAQRARQADDLAIAALEQLRGLVAAEHLLGNRGIRPHLPQQRRRRILRVLEHIADHILGAVRHDVGRRLSLGRGPQIEHRSNTKLGEALQILVMALKVIQLDGPVQLAGAHPLTADRHVSADIPQVRYRRYVDALSPASILASSRLPRFSNSPAG
jgi:hypothetical protein